MSDVKFEVVRFALSTAAAGNTQDVTISGFGTPKAAIFFHTIAVVDGTIASVGRMGIGFTDGTNEAAIDVVINDNATTSNTERGHRTDRVIAYTDANAEVVGFSTNSFITDGIRLDIDNATGTARLITCILIGGDGVSSAHVGTKDDLGTGTSAIDINTVGFEPDLVFMAGVGNAAALPLHAAAAILSWGAAINDGSDTQRVSMFGSQDGQATDQSNAYIGNDSITGQVYADALSWDAVIGGFDASGFSITPNASSVNDIVSYLCIEFLDTPVISLFDMAWPTSGNYAETTPAFTPTFGLISTVIGPSARNTLDTASNFGFGISAFDASTISSDSASNTDGAGTTVAKSVSASDLSVLGTDGTRKVQASSYAFDADGWDFTLTTNPAATALGWGLAIGPSVVTKTLKSTGGDYSLMSTWESTEQTDLVAAGQSHVLECYKGTTVTGNWQADGSLFNSVTVSGWTADAANNLTIKAAAGEEHGGVSGAGFWIYRTNGSTPILVNSNTSMHITIMDIEARELSGLFGRKAFETNDSNATCILERCIAHSSGSGTSVGFSFAGGSASVTARNCLAIGPGSAVNSTYGFWCNKTTNITLENCSSFDNSFAGFYLLNDDNQHEIRNCVAYNNTTDFVNMIHWDISLNNASGDTTATGTGAVTGITSAAFVDYAGGDYHPAAGGALAGAAIDLSADFTDDITGATR